MDQELSHGTGAKVYRELARGRQLATYHHRLASDKMLCEDSGTEAPNTCEDESTAKGLS